MSLRFPIVVVALLLCVVAAGAAEIPLSDPPLGPSPGFKEIVASIATPDGFLTVRTELAVQFGSKRLVAARISRDGEILDPRGIVIGELDHSMDRTYDLRAEGGGYVLTVMTPDWRGPTIYEYEQKRITLDAEARVVASETTVLPKAPQTWPANHYGDTLRVGNPPEYSALTIFFVGRNGTPRNPTKIPELYVVLHIVPYEDEWLIVGRDFNGRLRWYRIKESTRDKPRRTTIATPPADHTTIVHADGYFGVLRPKTNTSSQSRSLAFHVVAPNGAHYAYTLLMNEPVHDDVYSRPRGTVAKEGDSWIVAYRWLDSEQHERMRMWRITVGKKIESTVLDGITRFDPVLASGATSNLLLLRREPAASRRGWHDVYAQVFDRGTFPTHSHSPSLLSRSHPLQTNPAAASGTYGVFSAWNENDGDVVVRFIGADGTSTAPAVISSPAWQAQAPAVARNGNTFIVGWQEWYPTNGNQQKVLVARFDERGAPIDAEPILIQRRKIPWRAGMSIAAEGDGFRMAWTGLPLPDAFGRDDEHAVFTTHVAARGEEVSEPEPLFAQGQKRASWRPIVVSNGNDAIVLYTHGSDVAEMHYSGGAGVPNFPSVLALNAVTVAAATNSNELLLATVRSSADGTAHCTWAQRLSFSGVKLAPAEPLECSDVFPARTSVVWDRNRWWVTSSASPAQVHELHADGTVVGLKEIFPATVQPHLPFLFTSDAGTSAVYVRVDETTDFIERAFLRTFPRPKARSARP